MTFGLNTKEDQMIALSTEISAKLDDIITLLGGAPPAPVHTLDDLYAILSDIHTDTMSMDAKLLVIRDAVTGPEGFISGDTYDNLAWNIFRLRAGSVATDMPPVDPGINIQEQLNVLYLDFSEQIAIIKNQVTNISGAVAYAFQNAGLRIDALDQTYTGYLEVVRNSILALKGSIGVPADALHIGDVGSRDVIQLLSLIGELGSSQVGSGIAPLEQCPDAYISGGMALVPTVFEAWPPTIWAVWPDPPPTGITFGTVFGIGVDFTELVVDGGTWENWKIFVASSAANFGMYLGGDVEASLNRYPTNVWWDLDDYPYNLSVFVGGSDSLRCYLCHEWTPGGGSGGPWGGGGGSGGPWFGDCADSTSAIYTVTYAPGTSPPTHTRQYAPLSGLGLVLSDHFTWSGGTATFNVGDAATTTNMIGSRVTLISGSFVRVAWTRVSDNSAQSHELTSTGANYVVTEDTAFFTIDNFQSNSITPGPAFVVELCPPGSF